MTIPRVWSNGVASIPVDALGRPKLTNGNIASLDTNVQKAVDKIPGGGGNAITGPITLSDNGVISLDSPTASFIVTTGGAYAGTANGGRVVCGDGDVPLFSAPRTRTVTVDLLEAYANQGGSSANAGFGLTLLSYFPNTPITWKWYVDFGATLSFQAGDHDTGAAFAGLIVPLTRLHDGATLTSAVAKFAVASSRTSIAGNSYPLMNILRIDPFYGTVVSLRPAGPAVFGTPANIAAYKNSGNPNSITFTPTANNVIDMSKYIYVLIIQDENYAADGTALSSLMNSWEAVVLQHSVSSLQFQ